MRYLIDQQSYEMLKSRNDHTPDCFVRPGEYLHHIYIEGVKYVVARALKECMIEATQRKDTEALNHLQLHKEQLDMLATEAQKSGALAGARLLGNPAPVDDEETEASRNTWMPPIPQEAENTGLARSLLFEMILRVVYNQGRPTGGTIARTLRLPYRLVAPLLDLMRQQENLEVAGRNGLGDINYEYVLTQRGARNVEDALKKTEYAGAAPVPFEEYLAACKVQSIKGIEVTRRNIRRAFSDLIISEPVLNEIGPAINSASSIFLFGYPGNGKTSIAERITRLLGDAIYIPYAVEAGGQIIKLFDKTLHDLIDIEESEGLTPPYDLRWAKIKRPVVVVGGELTMPMLALNYNEQGKFYETPLQMKANGGIFMIDDFGRQQVRPMDLLNRWIVPLEKRYDYLTTVAGTKLEIPFDEILIFSTNLDPNQLADEAFLRRIKFKIEVRDPDEPQWRKIWELVCKGRKVKVDHKGIDYLIEKWYKPDERPFRMCQPRDILDQMMSIAKYNMEEVTFSPDLIDAACATYFVSKEKRTFGAAVRLD
ncbi:MAG: ATP-binding protein [Ardenticatenales bacterium]|nr:ATP-binding protein [Ardenticatenales bacterium]